MQVPAGSVVVVCRLNCFSGSMWEVSSPVRDWTYVPCIARQIPNHRTTREVLLAWKGCALCWELTPCTFRGQCPLLLVHLHWLSHTLGSTSWGGVWCDSGAQPQHPTPAQWPWVSWFYNRPYNWHGCFKTLESGFRGDPWGLRPAAV